MQIAVFLKHISLLKLRFMLNPFSEFIRRDAVISSKDYAVDRVALRKTVVRNSPGLQCMYIHLHLFLKLYLLPNFPLTSSGPFRHPTVLQKFIPRLKEDRRTLRDRFRKTYYLTLASNNRRYVVGSVT